MLRPCAGHGHLHRAVGTQQRAMDANLPVLAGLYFAGCLPGGIRDCRKAVQSGTERPGHRVCRYYWYDRTGLVPYFLGLSGDFGSFRIGIFVLGVLTAMSSGLLWLLRDLE